MTERLRDYQVLDVMCGGTFYKVKHKATNKIFAWKAYDCTAYSDKQIQNVVREVKTISGVHSNNLLRYYDTILHVPTKTLYFVLEYNSWRSLDELVEICTHSAKHIAENFIWYLIFELSRLCKDLEQLHLVVLRKCVTINSIFVGDDCHLRVNCFELANATERPDLMRQLGGVVHGLCYQHSLSTKKKEFFYSDDLRDVIAFITNNKNRGLHPDVLLHHPTVLANLEMFTKPKQLNDIFVSDHKPGCTSDANKCDSEKAVELCRTVEPQPRTHVMLDSPIYSNISPNGHIKKDFAESNSDRGSLSPTLAALALELPGFVPRSRKPLSQALESYKPQQISEETLSQQWMSRLIALRHREDCLNKRERELISKEIVNSPTTKFIPLNYSIESESNGITLPAVINQAEECNSWVSRRRQRRVSSTRQRPRRKSYAYEDLDSSLSADTGDDSIIVTATKFTKKNMPQRNIFPDIVSKKVHFTSTNPFAVHRMLE